MKIKTLVLSVLIAAAAAAGFAPVSRIMEKRFLPGFEGSWEKIKPETELGGYYIKIRFEGDKFYYRLYTYVDYIDGKNPCVKKHGWTEYAFGEYLTDTAKLYLKGNWCDSTYSVKQDSGCFHTGVFEESYYFKLDTDTLILNRNEANFDDKKQYNHIYDKMTFVRR